MNEMVIDTNILLRHLLQDIPSQSSKATEFIGEIERQEKAGSISILVVNELIWILERYYKLKGSIFIPKLLKIFTLEHIKIIEVKKAIILRILERMQKQKIDFTDLYLASIAPYEQIMSFDQDFKKLFK